MYKPTVVALVVLVLVWSCSAELLEERISEVWKQTMTGIGTFNVVDLDDDGSKEILVAFNDSIFVLNSTGKIAKSYLLGNTSGSIYAVDAADINGNGRKELVVGVGGMRVINEYGLYGFETPENKSIVWKTKVLHETLNTRGSIVVLDLNGSVLWSVETNDSVNALGVCDLDGNVPKEIIGGVGDYAVDTYNEYKGTDANGTAVWELVDYPKQDGWVYVFNSTGVLRWGYKLKLVSEGKEVVDADNNVKRLQLVDVNQDGINEIFAGSDNGWIYLLNRTGSLAWSYGFGGAIKSMYAGDINRDNKSEFVIGSGDNYITALDSGRRLLWRYRLGDFPSAVYVTDFNLDESEDILVASWDRYIYSFDKTGGLQWKYFVGERIYSMFVADIDNDGYEEIITASPNNLTVFKLNENYLTKQQADRYYNKSLAYFESADYGIAIIYAQKARDLYTRIEDGTGVSKAKKIIDDVERQLRLDRKLSADEKYTAALNFYSKSEYDTAEVYVNSAKSIYKEINDDEGVGKCDKLLARIENERTVKRRIDVDAVYAKAMLALDFNNYTAARDYALEAREDYNNLGATNDAEKCDLIINRVGEAYYETSQRYFNEANYTRSREYSQLAKETFMLTRNTEGVTKVEMLLTQLDAAETSEQERLPSEPSTLPYVVFAVLIVASVVIVVRSLRK